MVQRQEIEEGFKLISFKARTSLYLGQVKESKDLDAISYPKFSPNEPGHLVSILILQKKEKDFCLKAPA